MILTNCAACAAPLAHTAPRCVRCMPYQIELDRGCLIFARHDDDRSIRRAID